MIEDRVVEIIVGQEARPTHCAAERGTVLSAEPPHHRAGILAGAMTYLIPEVILPLQELIDLVPIGEIVGDGTVHFLKAQSGIELRNRPSSRSLALTFAVPESRGVRTPTRIASC